MTSSASPLLALAWLCPCLECQSLLCLQVITLPGNKWSSPGSSRCHRERPSIHSFILPVLKQTWSEHLVSARDRARHWTETLGVLVELEALWGRQKKKYQPTNKSLLQKELSPDPEHEKASTSFMLRPSDWSFCLLSGG